jgi:O-antigen ligase
MVLWSDAWSALMGDDQLIGRGLGATDLFFANRYTGLRSIHNGYLLLLVDVGVLGALLCVLFYSHRLVRLTRDITGEHRTSGRASLAVALLIVFLVASLMESTFAGYAFPSLLWLSLAWAGWSQQGAPKGTVT